MTEVIKIPNHVVIIPDGNRRWAKDRGLDPWDGHEEGAKRTEEIVREASKLGVKNLSVWGSSLNNLTKRPLMEKRALLDIYKKYFQKLIEDSEVFETQTKINVIGRWREQFPDSIKKVIENCIKKTKDHKKRTLNFLLAYNGDDEMVSAVKKIVEKVKDSSEVTAEMIKDNLMTRELPAVDYVIRTGGEPHWSVGFMMWDIANAEFYFSDKLFPDFDKSAFKEAIIDYGKRGRRKGK